jgi:hypothetical protein
MIASTASAQPKRTYRTVRGETAYAAEVVNVPLQPFSLDRQSPIVAPAMQVAYYAPPRTPRAEPVERDEEEPQSTPQFETRGSQPMVPGNRAILRNGVAYAPSNAPDSVKHAIWAVNTIRNRPYV